MARKKYAEAEPLLQQSLAMRKKVFGENHATYAVGLSSLAGLHYARREWGKAEELLRQTLEVRLRAQGERSPDYAHTLSNLALVLDAAGKPDKALPLARQGVAVSQEQLNLLASIQSEREQLVQLRQLRGQLDLFLSLAVRCRARGEEIYAPVLGWKGSVFARQRRLRERRLLQGPGFEEAARSRADLDAVVRQMAALGMAQRVDLKNWMRWPCAKINWNATWRARRPLSALAVNPRSGRPGNCKRPFLPTWPWWITSNSSTPRTPGLALARRIFWPWSCATAGPSPGTIWGPTRPLVEAINAWRATIQRRTRPASGKDDPAFELRRRLWAPLAKDLAGVRTVLVSPDGAVARLPFAALPGEDAEKYLIEELAVAVVPSPRDVPGLLAPRPARGKLEDPALLVVGDVDFGAGPGAKQGMDAWSALPGTRGEMLSVRDSFERKFPFPDGQTHVLRGARATPDNFRRQVAGHRWLHIATHAFYAPQGLHSALEGGGSERGLETQPPAEGQHPGLLSGLVLAGANRPAGVGDSQGVLSALEVAELDLESAELAVLSACKTGLGPSAGGEGLLGLQLRLCGGRRPHRGGQSLVRLGSGHAGPDGTVLRSALAEEPVEAGSAAQAQLILLREGHERGMVRRDKDDKSKRVPPFYWAAFVLSGDWR